MKITDRKRYYTLVRYSERNSGGYYRVGAKRMDALLEAGWLVYPDVHTATMERIIESDSLYNAQQKALSLASTSWETATGLCLGDMGCSCCGHPHTIEVEDSSEAMSDADFMREEADCDGATYWDWATAPEWVKEKAPLNGDDVSVVAFLPAGMHSYDTGGGWCSIVHVWSPKGLLRYHFHA